MITILGDEYAYLKHMSKTSTKYLAYVAHGAMSKASARTRGDYLAARYGEKRPARTDITTQELMSFDTSCDEASIDIVP